MRKGFLPLNDDEYYYKKQTTRMSVPIGPDIRVSCFLFWSFSNIIILSSLFVVNRHRPLIRFESISSKEEIKRNVLGSKISLPCFESPHLAEERR
jgi:hypothetical protein